MANYESLKATIDAYIRQNGVKAITGPVLNGVLNAMVDSLGDGFLFEGEALPNSPGETPDQNVVRYATRPGTYTNYGGYVHDGKHLVWMVWMGSWNAYPTQVPTDASLPTLISQLTNDAGYITAASLNAYYTKVQTDALLSGKQATLVSGSNIKTINNESLLGPGNIDIQGGGGTQADWDEADPTDPSYIKNKPTIPSAPGTLDTDNTTAQTVSSNESLAGTVKLHKVSKTGSYNDLDNLPSIPAPQVQSDWDEADVDAPAYIKNKPSIPAAQVQSDWNEADNTDPAYIKNKPTIPGPDIFWAEYGVTTAAEIEAASAAGKMVALSYNDKIYTFQVKTSGNILYFYCVEDYNHRWARVNSSDVWTSGSYVLEWTSNKVSTISGNETNTTKYPNTKAVADAIGKMGVIRQTQTWTQAADGGYDYTMSNPVRGLIPQANIDLFESAGAVFNEQTGYFELNGLTDLSYEEMQAVYDANFSAKMVSMNIANALRIVKPARTVSLSDGVVYFSSSLINALRVGSGGDGAGDSSIEVVAVGTIGGYPSNASSIQQILYKCPYVKRVGIFQPINFTSTSPSNASLAFQNCFSLEEVMLTGLAVSIEIKNSPRLTAASVAYIINNAGTAAITITLHATAYARATADAAVTAALAAKPNVTLASA